MLSFVHYHLSALINAVCIKIDRYTQPPNSSADGSYNELMHMPHLVQCVPEKQNWELSMFYHNLITFIINKWHIFVKLRSSSSIWCNSCDAYFMHDWLKSIWRKGYQKVIWRRYLNFKEKKKIGWPAILSLNHSTEHLYPFPTFHTYVY